VRRWRRLEEQNNTEYLRALECQSMILQCCCCCCCMPDDDWQSVLVTGRDLIVIFGGRAGRAGGSPSPQCACGGSACAAGRRRYRSWLLSVKVAVPCCIASIPRVGGLFTRAGADVGRAYVARLVASLRGRAVGRSAVLGSAAL